MIDRYDDAIDGVLQNRVNRSLSASTEYIEKRTKRLKLPIQFVQVLTNFWYSHT